MDGDQEAYVRMKKLYDHRIELMKPKTIVVLKLKRKANE